MPHRLREKVNHQNPGKNKGKADHGRHIKLLVEAKPSDQGDQGDPRPDEEEVSGGYRLGSSNATRLRSP